MNSIPSIKRILMIGLGLFLFSCPVFAQIVPGIDFSFRLFKSLVKPKEEENFIFSPYAIRSGLGLVAFGARGKTQKQLGKPPETWITKKDPSYKLWSANRLWVQRDYPLLESYLIATDKEWGVRPWMVDFTKAPDFLKDRINGWVEEKTLGKLKDFFTEDSFDASLKMVLSTALAFKGEWVTPFERSHSKEEEFRNGSGDKVRASFVVGSGQFSYLKTREVEVLELPYLDSEISMVLLLPTSPKGLSNLEQNLKAEVFEHWMTGLSLKAVNVSIPKFDMDTTLEISETLKAFGILDAFSPADADFSGMAEKKGLFLGRAFHKTAINLTEAGTEVRSDSSLSGGARTPAGGVSLSFHARHPFLFLIRYRATNSILFMGHVNSTPPLPVP